jgi:integrase
MPEPISGEPSVRELLTLYEDLLWENGRHKENVRGFLGEIHEIMLMHGHREFDDGLLDLLVKEFRRKNNSNATINRKLSALFKLLRKAERMGQIPRLPSYLRLKEKNGRIRFLSREEEASLFAAIGRSSPDFERLCVFLVDSGARVGEALGLKWTDIQGANATFWLTKSGRSRTVPLTRRALEAALSAPRAGNTGPFSMIDYQKFRYHWNRARQQVGLGDDAQVVPHILRHTCASRLVQAGIDLRRVQTFLGHQTIQMTLRYAHLATNDLAQCAAALEAPAAAPEPAGGEADDEPAQPQPTRLSRPSRPASMRAADQEPRRKIA